MKGQTTHVVVEEERAESTDMSVDDSATSPSVSPAASGDDTNKEHLLDAIRSARKARTESFDNDEEGSTLETSRKLYRQQREMRMAILQASKRFESIKREREERGGGGGGGSGGSGEIRKSWNGVGGDVGDGGGDRGSGNGRLVMTRTTNSPELKPRSPQFVHFSSSENVDEAGLTLNPVNGIISASSSDSNLQDRGSVQAPLTAERTKPDRGNLARPRRQMSDISGLMSSGSAG